MDFNNNVVSSYLLNSAYMNNFAKSDSDVIESGVPSSMRPCHKYIIMSCHLCKHIIYNTYIVHNDRHNN